MTEDQRFAERRPDVSCFKTAPFKEKLTVGGEIEVELEVELTTTDADFIVKVIDEFPEDFTYDKTKEKQRNTQPMPCLKCVRYIRHGKAYCSGFSWSECFGMFETVSIASTHHFTTN